MAEAKETKKKVIKSKKEVKPVEVAAVENTEVVADSENKEAESTAVTTKAGKHSAKAIRELEEKKAKEERKATGAESSTEKTVKRPVKARTKAERAGKKYREAFKLIEKDKLYKLPAALELATKTSTTKFDATVELHINLGVDPRQADQNVRDTVVLPAGTGKTIRVAVLADDDDAKKAKAAGADIAGSDNLLADLEKEQIDFDVLIATPTMMARLGKYARMLGPRGLMPNPKSGTVTADVASAVKDAKAGRVEYRVDQAGIIHLGIGKVSFGGDKLTQNAEAIMASVRSAKPSGLKANYIKAITVTTSMGPGIKVEIS